jgi:hypothetical protein
LRERLNRRLDKCFKRSSSRGVAPYRRTSSKSAYGGGTRRRRR